MRIIVISALLMGAIGCGDGTVEVQSLEPNGARSIETVPEGDALDLRRSALWTGVAYMIGCGTQRYPTYGGELVFFEGTGYNGYCLATSASSTVMGASLAFIEWDHAGAPGYTADENVGSWKVKATASKWARLAWHESSEAGGPNPLEVFVYPNTQSDQSIMSLTTASSVVLNLDPIPHP
jgi:hypothetical protein